MTDTIGVQDAVRLAEEEHDRALGWLEQLRHSHPGRAPMPGEPPQMFAERVERFGIQLAAEQSKAEALVEAAYARLARAINEANAVGEPRHTLGFL